MNTELQTLDHEQQAPAATTGKVSVLEIMTSREMMQQVIDLAKIMAGSKITVPKHLQGNEGDCCAIALQSMAWGMNPFAVGQKTHLVNGTLGYEAQLVNAVIQESGAIVGRFHYEYTGDGEGVSCRVGAIISGESEITWGEWLSAKSVTTKNSPLWKTNIKQQMGYLQVKNWGRAFCPGAILGVYSVDELEGIQPEKEINPAPRRQTGTQAGEAARQQSEQAADSPERAELIRQLELVASEYGIDAYAETWSKLSKAQRTMVGAAEHDRLKKVAASIPAAAETVNTETGEISND